MSIEQRSDGENLGSVEGVLALWHLAPHLPHYHSNFRIENSERGGDRLFFVLPEPLPFWFVPLQSQHNLFPTREKKTKTTPKSLPLRKYLDLALGQHHLAIYISIENIRTTMTVQIKTQFKSQTDADAKEPSVFSRSVWRGQASVKFLTQYFPTHQLFSTAGIS